VLATAIKPGGHGKTVQVLAEFDAGSPAPKLVVKKPNGKLIAAAYVPHDGGARLCVLDRDLAFSALVSPDDAGAEDKSVRTGILPFSFAVLVSWCELVGV
jgi:hypothetical protein